jgi:transposase InsO family protein
MGGEDMKTKLAFIVAHASEHAIRFMCRVLGVAHSWFHAWQRAAPKRAERAARRDRLKAEIREIFAESKRRYGAPRIHAELQDRGSRISKRTVAKLMQENGIRPPRGKRRAPITTDSRHSHAIAPNLLDRNFEVAEPDTVWLADISYIPTDEGWLYLAAVKDLATTEIVGWSMSERLKSTLCEDALKMAIRNRRPPKGLIHHSDRGVQYACGDYRKLLGLHGIKASMSRKGNCLDNAPMESFFGSLKTELVHRTRFRTKHEARAALFEYIEIFYNRRRRHSSIGYRTPAQARIDMTVAQAA